MNVNRLNRLSEILSKVPEKSFDISKWTNQTSIENEVDCGTTACAVGWACFDKGFNEEGLHYTLGENSYDGREFLEPTFKSKKGWSAVEAFFGIESDIAFFLFDSDYYDNLHWYLDRGVEPRDVINRIKILLENKDVTSVRKLLSLSSISENF